MCRGLDCTAVKEENTELWHMTYNTHFSMQQPLLKHFMHGTYKLHAAAAAANRQISAKEIYLRVIIFKIIYII